MKKLLPGVIVVIVATVLFFVFEFRNSAPPKSQGLNSVTSEISRSNIPAAAEPQNPPSSSSNGAAANATGPSDLASRAASPNPAPGSTTTNEEPALPPLTVLDKARVVMHNYRSAFGEDPVGTNPEITAALMGKNSKQINFVANSGLRVNEKGEMVDAYGTPFFFHQISGQIMEIRSAGPDHVMWTSDDLVTR
jgi:hypothetical protein